MFAFILRHPIALLVALFFHGLIIAAIIFAQVDSSEVIKVKLGSSPEKFDNSQPLKTFAVDSTQVKLALAKIKAEEEAKLLTQQQLAKQTEQEKKHLAELKRKQEQERKKAQAEKAKADAAKKQADIERQKVKQQQKRAAEERAKADKAKQEAKQAEQKRAEARKKTAEAKKIREQEEAKSKKIAIEIKAKAAEKARLEKDAIAAKILHDKEAKAANLQRQKDEEDALQREFLREQEMVGLREAYISNIASKVRQNWRSAAKVSDQAECRISVTQTPQGNVSSVKVHSCNQYATPQFKKDAERAVYRSQPLPQPPIEELFERNITFIFQP